MSAEVARSAPSREHALSLLQSMLRIRRFEEKCVELYSAQKIRGFLHLYIGEEGVATGVCAHLTDADWIASTHRGHGHFLAKGGDPKLLVAEVYGREGGICRGMGGSMHVADFAKGILGANGIVGGGIGLAVGAALAAQLDRKGAVSVVFFGDGAANQGVLMEALNVSALWKLPLLLVCENNGFSEFSPTATVTAGAIADRAKPFGVPSAAVDGNDVIAVWQAANAAVRRACAGEGPSLIECRTYRVGPHSTSDDPTRYRPAGELERWLERDPLRLLRERLQAANAHDEAREQRWLEELDRELDAAIAAAESAARPAPSTLFDDVYAVRPWNLREQEAARP